MQVYITYQYFAAMLHAFNLAFVMCAHATTVITEKHSL